MRLIEFLEPLYEGAKLSRKDIANILAWFRMGFEAEFIYENGFTVHRMNKISLEDWDNLVDIIELKGGTSLIEVARVLIHNWDQFLKDYNSHQNIGLSPLHPRLIDKIKQGERTRDLPYLMSLLDSNVEMVPMGHALMRIKGVDWVMNNLRFSFKHAVQQDEDGHYMTVVPSSKTLFRKLAQEFEEWFGNQALSEARVSQNSQPPTRGVARHGGQHCWWRGQQTWWCRSNITRNGHGSRIGCVGEDVPVHRSEGVHQQ